MGGFDNPFETMPCGLSITGDIRLSKSRDQKVMPLLLQIENCSMDFFTAQICPTVAPLVTVDKEIFQSRMIIR